MEDTDPLQQQGENTQLKEKVDALKGELRDAINRETGLKQTVDQFKKQMQEVSMILGVQDDYAIIKGEIQKLICIEDDNEVLKSQLKDAKDSEGHEVGKAILKARREIEKNVGEIEILKEEIKLLRSRRTVDRYRTLELIKEAIKKFFRNIWEKMKGVIKRGNN